MVVKKVAVIGGTGAQGAAVIKALVQDGAYSVRVLTRDILIPPIKRTIPHHNATIKL